MRLKSPRQHDPAHLDFIRELPCCICGDNTSTEACHIRFSDARVCKPNAGVGAKPSDRWTTPLCGKHHREQHSVNERAWWESKGIDPIFLALALYSVSGDHERGAQIVANARRAEAA